MKFRTRPTALSAALLFGIIACLGGCATTGAQLAEKTIVAMQTVENDITQAVALVDVTMASLEDLMAPGQTDRTKAFAAYSDNVEKTDQLGKQVIKHAEQMAARGEKYFEEWDREGDAYSNAKIRKLSDQRVAELVEIYAKIPMAGVALRDAFSAYLSDIKRIQADLSRDLAPMKIEAVAPIARKAVTDSESLKTAVKPVISAIDRTKAELAQVGSK